MITCERCQAAQLRAVLEPETLDSMAFEALERHQEECPACRASAERLEVALAALEPIAVSEDILRATYEEVMGEVKRRSAQNTRKRDMEWLSVAAAASLLAGVGLWLALGRPDRPAAPVSHNAAPAITVENRSELPSVTQTPKSPLLAAFEQAQSAKEAFGLLQGAFDSATKSFTGGDYAEMIGLCDQLRGNWPDSDESLEAMKLISRCWTQLAEPKKAQESFIAYADETGARARQRLLAFNVDQATAAEEEAQAVAEVVLIEANRLFYTKDYMLALSYGDDLITRYPHTEPARRAQCLVGEYCMRTRQPAQAVETFKAIIQEAPDSPAAKAAQVVLPSALFNTGRKAEAAETWINAGKSFKDPEEQALGYYNAASLLVAQGNGRYSEAMAMAERVAREYPQSRYVPYAKSMVAWLQVEMQRKDVPVLNNLMKGKDAIDVLGM